MSAQLPVDQDKTPSLKWVVESGRFCRGQKPV